MLAQIFFSMCEGMKRANVITLIKREERLTANSFSCGSWKCKAFGQGSLTSSQYCFSLGCVCAHASIEDTHVYDVCGVVTTVCCSHFLFFFHPRPGFHHTWALSYALTAAPGHRCIMLWWIPPRGNIPRLLRGYLKRPLLPSASAL